MQETTREGSDRTELPELWPNTTRPTTRRWESVRRPELLDQFADQVYGRTPSSGRLDDVDLVTRRDDALDGAAIRMEAELRLAGPAGVHRASLLIYAPPKAADLPVPAFLGLNFQGNHAIIHDPDVRLSPVVAAVDTAHRRGLIARGSESRRWPVRAILDHGYAVATVWYEELEIDLPGFAGSGVRGLFPQPNRRAGDDWGAIGGWAWSLSRVLDALAAVPGIDQQAVIAVGHSRLGKTALWAAAQDQRFAGVVSNESGCGGAALFRHPGVEDINVITSARPHWFAPNFADHRGADTSLPVDQHQLLALQAPRLTHVGSAIRDAGADPVGEFLSTLYATPAFELYGHQGIRSESDAALLPDPTNSNELILPPTGLLVGGRLSYHVRDGDHDLLLEDWEHMLAAADQHLNRR